MRTKQRAAVPVEQRAARDRTEAYHDARALALELARGVPSARFDPMTAGVVLQSGETVYRRLAIWVRVHQDGQWAAASLADVLVTDWRLLCRFSTGRLTSFWWSGVVGLQIDLATEHVVLDFGDGQPVGLSGAQVGVVSVAAIASIYGVQAMVAHHALGPLRTRAPAPPEQPPEAATR